MKNKLNNFFSFLLNFFYIAVIFIISLAISVLALARKINVFDNNDQDLVFQVDREEILLTSATEGQVSEVYIKEGQMVKKGELLMKLANDADAAKLVSLEQISAENLSAKTEALMLKAQSAQYEVRAYSDGVIYKIHTVAGSYIPANTPLVTLFSNDNIKLTAYANPIQYQALQKQSKINVYSDRHKQVFAINFQGLGKVVSDNDQIKYEVYYNFEDLDDGMSFIQGENLIATSQGDTGNPDKIGAYIQRFVNSLVAINS